MTGNVLFVSPPKLYPVDSEGKPVQPLRQNVSLPALTVLGSLQSQGFGTDFIDMAAEGYENRALLGNNVYRFGLPDEAVVDRISETKPDAIMITSMFTTEQAVVDSLTRNVKRSFPALPVIVGGIHATLKPEWIMESGNVDFVVMGEGEETSVDLLRALESGDPLSVLGVAYRSKDRITRNTQRALITNLDRRWAFENVLLSDGTYRYNDALSRRSSIYGNLTSPEWTRSFSLYYSRGCPMHCDYCASTERDGFKVRHAGVERMFDDFQSLHEQLGVAIFYNQADTFGFHSDDIRFLEKVSEYRKTHPDFVLNNPNGLFARIFFPKSNGYELDESLLDTFAEAGFNVMTIAVETFNQKYSKKIDFGKIPPEKMKELFEVIHHRGMKTELYMIYAFPEQTKEELAYDEHTVESLGYIDRVIWQSCMVFPGTEYYRQGIREGWFTEESYRTGLDKGYFFHRLPEDFNFSKIPMAELNGFRGRHRLDIS